MNSYKPSLSIKATTLVERFQSQALDVSEQPYGDCFFVLATQCEMSEARLPRMEDTYLSDTERLRAGQYNSTPDKLRFIIGKMLTRMVLAELLAVEPSQITITTNEAGKPVLSPLAFYHMLPWFNISKSHDLVLLGVHFSRSIGVDIEKHQDIPELLHIAERCWGKELRQALAALPRDDRAVEFF